MLTPDFAEFQRLYKKYDVLPVYREIPVDFDTPVSLFAKVADGDYSFLLESLEGGERWGRYSFIGIRPIEIVRIKGHEVRVEGRKGTAQKDVKDPLTYLQDMFRNKKACELPGLPRFSGGAVGYLGYDMVRFIERLPENLPDTAGFHDAVMMFPEVVLCVDNLKQSLKIIFNVETSLWDAPEKAYEQATAVMEGIVRRIRTGLDYPEPLLTGSDFTRLSPEVSKERFQEAVKRAKEYIRAGDIIQVVLSQRFSGTSSIPPFELYRAVRRINPSPYLFYLKLGDEVLVGSSPEILVRLTGDLIELRPIAGTRPRGQTPEEDLALERELLSDPKEKAEHVMLVDLGRNDVGKVAEMGSVKVTDFMVIERYSHVMHIVSNVVGRLRKGADMFDVFRACFPAGTVSGAPKIRAMEIIEELEHARRGPYAGAVGYFGYNGSMDLAIAIRTLCQKGQRLFLQAGAGIVADSDPEREWQETINKGMALMKSIEEVQSRC